PGTISWTNSIPMQIARLWIGQSMHISRNSGERLRKIQLLLNVFKQFAEWGINLLRNKHIKSLLPEGLLWRLTFVNIFIVASFIVLSSLAIYNTACSLANDLGGGNHQQQFDSTLFQYLLIFSTSAIVVGSLIHFYLTRKLIRPLRLM